MFTITEEKIIETAEALKAAGKNPTQVAVREALGGKGSFATIGPALKRWKDGQKEEHALAEIQVPQAVTERLEQLQGAVWQAAVDEAERRLVAEREALKAAQEAAAAEVAEQLESVATLEAEADQLRQQIDNMEKAATTQAITVQSLEDDLADVKDQARDDSRTASEALAKEASRVEAAVERAERAETLHGECQTQARADLAELRKEHKAEQAAMKQDVKDAKTAATDQVKLAESKTQEQAERAGKAEKAAQVSAAGEQACQGRLEAAQREAEQTQKRLVALEEKASQAVQEAADLRGELKAIKDIKGKKNE
jgi:chromosome segregation ATPase